MAKANEAIRLVAKERKPTEHHRDAKEGWTIAPELREHIGLLFRSQAALCRHLGTNPKTWRDIQEGIGVREGTLRAVVIEFVSFLKKASDGKLVDARGDYHDEIASILYEQYSDCMSKLKFDSLLVPPEN
jgi:hypothetical protein